MALSRRSLILSGGGALLASVAGCSMGSSKPFPESITVLIRNRQGSEVEVDVSVISNGEITVQERISVPGPPESTAYEIFEPTDQPDHGNAALSAALPRTDRDTRVRVDLTESHDDTCVKAMLDIVETTMDGDEVLQIRSDGVRPCLDA